MVFVGVDDVSRKKTGEGTGRQTEHETLIARGCILCYAERCGLIITFLRVLLTTTGQRILTKDRIAPVLVTPEAGESSILAMTRCPVRTSLQPQCVCCGVCFVHSLMHFKGDKHLKLPSLPKGPGPRLIHGSWST